MIPRYRSFIPKTATERVLARYPSGAKERAEYLVGQEVVGVRYFHETGEPSFEMPQKQGRLHGVVYRWDEPHAILSTEPYADGLPHGTAKQWSRGKLIGTYQMVRGTGVDLWWGCSDGEVFLAEARFLRDGRPEGFEWWINDDQRSVYEERHFRKGQLHGIERAWNSEGRLRKGYPKYWVSGEKVSKRAYLTASRQDPSLPPFRERDNYPGRRFPSEVAEALGLQGRRRSPTHRR